MDRRFWVGLLIILVILIGLWFFYPEEEHTLCAHCCGPPPCCSYCGGEPVLAVKYKLYDCWEKNPSVKTTESEYIEKSDLLPKVITLNNEKIKIKEIDVDKLSNYTFAVYLIVEYNNSEEKIGFDYSSYSDNYGGMLVIETERWEGEPEVEGSVGTLFIRYISVAKIDYDLEQNDWNYILVGNQIYKEHRYPPTID